MTPPSFAWSTWHAHASRRALAQAPPAMLGRRTRLQVNLQTPTCRTRWCARTTGARRAHHVVEGYVEPPASDGHARHDAFPGGVGAHQRDQVYVPQHGLAVKQNVKDALPGAAPVPFGLRSASRTCLQGRG